MNSQALGILVGSLLLLIIPFFFVDFNKKTEVQVEVLPYHQTSVSAPSDVVSPKPASLDKELVNASLEAQYGLPNGILSILHWKEASGRCDLVSSAGAKGCFQFLDITIKDLQQRFNYSFDPNDYEQSAKAAAIKLSYLYKRIQKNYNTNNEISWSLALAAYNAGYTTITKRNWASTAAHYATSYRGVANIIDYKETSEYVNHIASNLNFNH